MWKYSGVLVPLINVTLTNVLLQDVHQIPRVQRILKSLGSINLRMFFCNCLL